MERLPQIRAPSVQARTILAVLLDAGGQWSHGYQLARHADVTSGTLHPLLIRPEERGYLEAEWQQRPKEDDRRGSPLALIERVISDYPALYLSNGRYEAYVNFKGTEGLAALARQHSFGTHERY